jgi:hypothetical protein
MQSARNVSGRSPPQQFRIFLGQSFFVVSRTALATKSQLFTRNPGITKYYRVQSDVPPDILSEFLQGLERSEEVRITVSNISYFLALAQEFGVFELADRCRRFSSVQPSRSSVRCVIISAVLFIVVVSLTPFLYRVILYPQFHCPFDASDPLNGMIAYLVRKHGGNLHSKGIVTVTAANSRAPYNPENLMGSAPGPGFHSFATPDQWICWDFHEMRVRLTNYSIRVRAVMSPAEWTMEASRDGENWTEIDYNSDREVGFRVITSAVSNTEEWRFLKFMQLKNNWNGENDLVVDGFDFFGTLLGCRR